jgi:hypothetical protein
VHNLYWEDNCWFCFYPHVYFAISIRFNVITVDCGNLNKLHSERFILIIKKGFVIVMWIWSRFCLFPLLSRLYFVILAVRKPEQRFIKCKSKISCHILFCSSYIGRVNTVRRWEWLTVVCCEWKQDFRTVCLRKYNASAKQALQCPAKLIFNMISINKWLQCGGGRCKMPWSLVRMPLSVRTIVTM